MSQTTCGVADFLFGMFVRILSPMNGPSIETRNLTLALQSPEQARAMIDALSPAQRREVSPEWLARLVAATSADPWVHGFTLIHRLTGAAVGTAGFKAPPGADATVEIAYGIEPEHQGRGYATEAASALTAFAFASGRVRVVRAHTHPERNASARVLTKCGFGHVGEVTDPEDGLVWRWEKLA
jgi:ribosomal-protein-alanine N-acetyltransferase